MVNKKEKKMENQVATQAFTHNGKFTVQSRVTGEHRTFQVKTQPSDARFAPGERIVSLLSGPDNMDSYTGFGFMQAGGIAVWTKKRGNGGVKSAFDLHAEILFGLVVDGAFSEYAQEYQLLAETTCRVCNRVLTEPESIRSGIGPICAERGF